MRICDDVNSLFVVLSDEISPVEQDGGETVTCNELI